MATSAFISYSHADTKALERLHKHMAMLKRDGLISTWHDKAILVGDRLGAKIDKALEGAGIFIALLSADYLASRYCYEIEFERALGMAESGQIRIVPIILEPCDWMSSPFQQFKALPLDGQPISEWANENNAYLGIINGLREVLEVGAQEFADGIKCLSSDPSGLATVRPVRLKRDFDTIDKTNFADKTFDIIREYFRRSCAELPHASDELKTRFEVIDATGMTCTIVNRGKKSGGESHITIYNTKGKRHFGGEISYTFEQYADPNTSHGSISVEADEYDLFLTTDSFGRSRSAEVKNTPEQIAEWLWNEFAKRAGVEYG